MNKNSVDTMTLLWGDEITKCWKIKECRKNDCNAKKHDIVCFLINNLEHNTKKTVGNCLDCEVFEIAKRDFPKLPLIEMISAIRKDPLKLVPTSKIEKSENINVLIVEDEPMNFKIAIAMLKNSKTTIYIAQNQEEAEEILHAKPIHFILLDIMYPENNTSKGSHPLGLTQVRQ